MIVKIQGFIALAVYDRYGRLVEVTKGRNIVTDIGQRYYVKKGAGKTPDLDFTGGGIKLGTSKIPATKSDIDVSSYIDGSYMFLVEGYPTADDTDTDNPYRGPDYVTWKYRYNYGLVFSNVNEAAIVDAEEASGALCHFLFSVTKSKPTDYIWQIWVNHKFQGV